MNQDTINGKIIANNIRAERNRSKLTQEYVAEKIGKSTRTYMSYEEDATNVTATILYILSTIFNCSISDFYVVKKSTKCEET